MRYFQCATTRWVLSHRGEAEVRLRTLEAGGTREMTRPMDEGSTTLQFSMHPHLQATEFVPFQTNDLPSWSIYCRRSLALKQGSVSFDISHVLTLGLSATRL